MSLTKSNRDKHTFKVHAGSGNSLLVVVPTTIAHMKGIKAGDQVEWLEDANGRLILRKV